MLVQPTESKEAVRARLLPLRRPIEIAVYDSSNYFNFGSIVRISHNFLARKLYAVDMPTGYYKKSALGTKKYEDIDRCSLDEFIEKTRGRNIVVLEKRDGLVSKRIYDYVWPDNPIMFFGGENFGVPDKILEVATDVVTIPVYGVWNDFNVAVSVGICVYDWHAKHREESHV